MTPKEKAEELVDKYRIILIQSDTDDGEESFLKRLKEDLNNIKK